MGRAIARKEARNALPLPTMFHGSTHARSLYKGRLAILPPARDLRARLGKASGESAPSLIDCLCDSPRGKT